MPARVRGEKPEASSRGCLYKLVVCNFKSYAGNLTIGPFKDFTCVIGPNGSGKSNLMDAVSFVVGVNTSQLRGAKLADFRTNLSTATEAPTSVTLYYHAPSENGAEPEEVQFTRTITVRDSSEYRVDGRKVDEKEYTKKLKSVGLLVKSRNFLVFQNEVEQVAQKSPKQLTELLERISGSEDLKADYEELQEEKNSAAQSAVAVYKRSLLVSNEKKQCKDQVKEATTYEKMLSEVAELKAHKYLFELYQIEKQMKAHANEAEEHAGKLEECKANCKAVEKATDKKARAKAEKQKEWSAFDKKVEECERDIKATQNREILKHETEVKSRRKDLAKTAEDLTTAQEKLQETLKKIKQDGKTHADLGSELQAMEEKNQSKAIQLGGQQTSQYNTLKQMAGAKSHKAKQALDKSERAVQEDEGKRDQLKSELSRKKQRREDLEAKVKDQTSLRVKHGTDHDTLNEQKHKLKSEIEDLDKKLKSEIAQRKVLQEIDVKMMSEMGDARADQRSSKHQEQFKEHLEYLMQSFPGVRGRVSDLCKVRQKQHELAIAVVMDSNMDAVIVDKEETVRRCIEHLKDKKVRPMNFLPLDSISAHPPDERLRMINGAKLALDLIDFDKAVEKAMWYATGNTVVVPTFEDAKRLAFGSAERLSCKVVSANDASVITKSGAITGGDYSSYVNKAQRFGASDFEKLQTKYQQNHAALQAVLGSIAQHEKEFGRLQRHRQEVDHKATTAKKLRDGMDGDFTTRSKEIDILKKQEKEEAPKTDELEKSIREKQKSLETDQEAYHKITDEVFKDFCKELKIANIVEYEGGTLKEQRDRTDRLNQLAKQVAMLKGKIDKDKTSEESLRKKVESFKTGMAKDQKEMEAFSAKVEASKKKLKDAMEAKAEEKRKRDQVMDDIDEIEKQLREVQAVLKKTHDDRDGAAKLVERAESLMEKLSAQRTSLLEQSELDEVELPKRKGAGAGEEEDAEMEEGDDAMEVDDSAGHSQPAKRVKKAIAEARLDYSKVPREQKRDMPDKEKKRVLEDLEEKQKKIAESLGTMNPNMKAFEQLKEIEARYEEVQGEMQAAKQKSQDLTKSFDEVRKKRCEMFNACFDHVKSCIDKIYKELTSDPTKAEQSVGGSAYLTLNNQDEPYLDGIKYDTIPPGKRFMDMTHLSGGEKTVAALALLFAINSYFPAPFIVLDEVDAALDSRNVAKVTRYIQARRQEQQCVIISLKERFYEKADGLVGICRDITGGHSNVFTLDLTQYAEA